jgi:hypothetical protein
MIVVHTGPLNKSDCPYARATPTVMPQNTATNAVESPNDGVWRTGCGWHRSTTADASSCKEAAKVSNRKEASCKMHISVATGAGASEHSHQGDCDDRPRAVQNEGIQLVCKPHAVLNVTQVLTARRKSRENKDAGRIRKHAHHPL